MLISNILIIRIDSYNSMDKLTEKNQLENLEKKLKETFKNSYKFLHPNLLSVDGWNFDKDFVNNFQYSEIFPNLFSFKFLDKQTCTEIIEETKNFENFCDENNLLLHRPNSMNKYGVLMNGGYGIKKCSSRNY